MALDRSKIRQAQEELEQLLEEGIGLEGKKAADHKLKVSRKRKEVRRLEKQLSGDAQGARQGDSSAVDQKSDERIAAEREIKDQSQKDVRGEDVNAMDKVRIGGKSTVRQEVDKQGRTKYRDEKSGRYANEEAYQDSESRISMLANSIKKGATTGPTLATTTKANQFGISSASANISRSLGDNAGSIQKMMDKAEPGTKDELKKLIDMMQNAQTLRGQDALEAKQKIIQQKETLRLTAGEQGDALISKLGMDTLQKDLNKGSRIKEALNIDQDATGFKAIKQAFSPTRLFGDPNTGGLSNFYTAGQQEAVAKKEAAVAFEQKQQNTGLNTAGELLEVTKQEAKDDDKKEQREIKQSKKEQLAKEGFDGGVKESDDVVKLLEEIRDILENMSGGMGAAGGGGGGGGGVGLLGTAAAGAGAGGLFASAKAKGGQLLQGARSAGGKIVGSARAAGGALMRGAGKLLRGRGALIAGGAALLGYGASKIFGGDDEEQADAASSGEEASSGKTAYDRAKNRADRRFALADPNVSAVDESGNPIDTTQGDAVPREGSTNDSMAGIRGALTGETREEANARLEKLKNQEGDAAEQEALQRELNASDAALYDNAAEMGALPSQNMGNSADGLQDASDRAAAQLPSSGAVAATGAAGATIAGMGSGDAALTATMARGGGQTAAKATSVGGRLMSGLKTAGRVVGKVALPVTAGLAAYDAYKGFNADENASFGDKLKNAGSSVLSGLTFGLLGTSADETKEQAVANGPAMEPESGDGDDSEDGKAKGKAVKNSHPETGDGFQPLDPDGNPVVDAQGRPAIFTKENAEAFSAMIADSDGAVKGSDIASSQRSLEKNIAVGGATRSKHMTGSAMDIHGTSNTWIRQNGSQYGWRANDYSGSHGGHFIAASGGPLPSGAALASAPMMSSGGGGGGGGGGSLSSGGPMAAMSAALSSGSSSSGSRSSSLAAASSSPSPTMGSIQPTMVAESPTGPAVENMTQIASNQATVPPPAVINNITNNSGGKGVNNLPPAGISPRGTRQSTMERFLDRRFYG